MSENIELKLVKGKHVFIIRTDTGSVELAIDALGDWAKRNGLPFDWFDAAILSHDLNAKVKASVSTMTPDEIRKLEIDRDNHKAGSMAYGRAADKVFQGPDSLLPNFLKLGDCKIEGIVRLGKEHVAALTRIAALEAENAKLREALKFYADVDTYEQVDVLGICPFSGDLEHDREIVIGYGKRARAALATESEAKP